MKQNGHIFAIAIIFVLVAKGLEAISLWKILSLGAAPGFLFQGLLFLAFYFVLRNTLFNPYIHILHEREEQTTGKKLKVEATQEKADQLLAQYESAINEAKLKAVKERERALLKAEEEAKVQIDQVKKKSMETVAQEKAQIEMHAAEARLSLGQNVVSLKTEITQKVMASVKSIHGARSESRAQAG